MAEVSFGEKLSGARRNRGLSISQVSGVLRIRSSIIKALEASNFENIPLKGYARNMVSTYARFLGLNPIEITEMFLHDYHVYEAYSTRRAELDLESRPKGVGIREVESDARSAGDAFPVETRKTRRTISLAARNAASASFWNPKKILPINEDVYTFRQVSRLEAERRHKSQFYAAPIDNRVYSARRSSGTSVPGIIGSILFAPFRALARHPILLIVIVVILALASLVIIATAASSCSHREPEVIHVTTDLNESATVSEAEVGASLAEIAQQQENDPRYGPFELKVEVQDGDSWLVIEIDGKRILADVVSPPFSETYTVASDAYIESGAPNHVKIYRNGAEVQFDLQRGIGIATLEVEQKPTTNAGTGSTGSTGTGSTASSTGTGVSSGSTGTGATTGATGTTSTTGNGSNTGTGTGTSTGTSGGTVPNANSPTTSG